MKRFALFAWLLASVVLAGAVRVEAKPARSVQVTFHNQSKLSLEKVSEHLDHGIWTRHPPKTIAPNWKVGWASESNGIATGTEGRVTYRIKGGGQVVLWWDNPYAGGNSYDAGVPENYQIPNHGGSGHNARVEWFFRPFVIPPIPSAPITSMAVRIVTSGEALASNSSDKYFDIGPLGWKLKPAKHKQGSTVTHQLDLHRLNLTTDDLVWMRLQKKSLGGVNGSGDGPSGEWKPARIDLLVNNLTAGRKLVLSFEVNEWLRNSHPNWQVVLRPRLSGPQRFAHSLRMIRNNTLDATDKAVAFLTTTFAKNAGISGWKKTNVPVTFATGKVAWTGKSTDGLDTIDIALESLRCGNETFSMDEKHGFHLQRYLRVEYQYKKGPFDKAHPRPQQGQRVQIGGTVWWDTDLEWWYEIHPRGPQDVKGLPARQAQRPGPQTPNTGRLAGQAAGTPTPHSP